MLARVVLVGLVWLICNAIVFLWALGIKEGNYPMDKLHLIVAGNPTDGFAYIGPFSSFVEAVHYADAELAKANDPWWIAPLDGPDNDNNVHQFRQREATTQ
jgi:hypothetical protein